MAKIQHYIICFAALVALLLLAGCGILQDRPIDYLLARAAARLSAPAPQPPAVLPTGTIAPTKIVSLKTKKQTPTPSQATPAVISGRINTSSRVVIMRSGPGETYSIIDSLSAGQGVEVTGRNPAGNWWRIKAEGREGWISLAYLTVNQLLAVPCVGAPGECAAP